MLVTAVSSLLSAAVATIGLGAPYWLAWRMAWIADCIGMLVVGSAILVGARGRAALPDLRSLARRAEAVALGASLVAVAWTAFAVAPAGAMDILLAYLVFPLVVWSAMRFGPFGAAMSLCVLAAISAPLTLAGSGTFAEVAPGFGDRLFALQVYLTLASLSALMPAAVTAERGRAEESLRDSEYRWKFALEGSGDGLWDWDVAAGTMFYSRRWKEMLGYSEDEIGSTLDAWERLVHPDDLARSTVDVQEHFDGLTPLYVNEHRIRCKDGSWKWMLDRGLVVSRDESGKPLRMIGTHHDITDRKQVAEALRESELQYRRLLDLLPSGVVVHQAGKIVFANSAAAMLSGPGGAANLIGTPLIDHVHPDSRAVVIDRVQRVARGEQVMPLISEKLLRPDGTAFDAEVAAMALRFDGGPAMLAVFSDITERRRAEAALRDGEERLRNVLEHSLDASYRRNLRTDSYDYLSPVFTRITGYTPDEMRSLPIKTVLGMMHPDDVHEVERVLADATTTTPGTAHQVEYRFRHKDGRYRWLRDRFTVVVDAEGRPLALVGSEGDITDRKEAEASVTALALRNETLLNTAGDGIHVLDELGNVVEANPAFCNMLGYTREEMLHLNVTDWNSERSGADLVARVRDLIDHPGVFETRHLRKDGTIRDVEINAIGVMLEGRAYLYASARDITERKMSERLIRESLREQEALLKEVHHRVKNNLQVIASLLRLESGRSAHSDIQSVLRDMQGRIQSLALLHETLYRSGTFATVDLGDYLRQLTAQAFRALASRSGAIRLEVDVDSATVDMDKAIPCGLLVNELVSNSLKHGFPDGRGGKVRVELRRQDGASSVCLRVSDTGVGLPEDFEARRGKSLGLQLVADLARQLDGSLEIGRGPGAVFDVRFALREQASS